MSKLRERLRNRRDYSHRTRAIELAMRDAPSATLRRELLEIASRYQ
jgi:hypothetical protein